MTGVEFLAIAVQITFGMLIVALVLAFFRLAKGPSLPDRVVALDMMTILIVAFCGVAAVLADDKAFLDVAVVLALVGFLATVALARYAERRLERDKAARELESGAEEEI